MNARPPVPFLATLLVALGAGCSEVPVCGLQETTLDWDEGTNLGRPADVLAEGDPAEEVVVGFWPDEVAP